MKKSENFYENPIATRSKQLLTNAFIELLKDKSVKSIKISTLCKKAGVVRPTFYAHYNTIEDIPQAYFCKWLSEVEIWVDHISQVNPSLLIDPENKYYLHFGELLFGYWCTKVEIVKGLQKAGFGNVILQCFIKAHGIAMKKLVGPTFELPMDFQNFLQSKAAIVAYELYKHWLKTDMQLSVKQLAEINYHLNTREEIVEIKRISMGIKKQKAS